MSSVCFSKWKAAPNLGVFIPPLRASKMAVLNIPLFLNYSSLYVRFSGVFCFISFGCLHLMFHSFFGPCFSLGRVPSPFVLFWSTPPLPAISSGDMFGLKIVLFAHLVVCISCHIRTTTLFPRWLNRFGFFQILLPNQCSVGADARPWGKDFF